MTTSIRLIGLATYYDVKYAFYGDGYVSFTTAEGENITTSVPFVITVKKGENSE